MPPRIAVPRRATSDIAALESLWNGQEEGDVVRAGSTFFVLPPSFRAGRTRALACLRMEPTRGTVRTRRFRGARRAQRAKLASEAWSTAGTRTLSF